MKKTKSIAKRFDDWLFRWCKPLAGQERHDSTPLVTTEQRAPTPLQCFRAGVLDERKRHEDAQLEAVAAERMKSGESVKVQRTEL